jgi:hypothetical protein
MGKLRGRVRLDYWEVCVSSDTHLSVYYHAERLQTNGDWLPVQLRTNCAI